MDVHLIRQKLTEAPNKFLTAVSSSAALEAFDDEWLALRGSVEEAVELTLLDDEDIALARATVSLVATLGDCFIDLDHKATTMSSSLMDTVQTLVGRLSISDFQSTSPAEPFEAYVSRSATMAACPSKQYNPLPTYIYQAYTWLLDNIHDPYPSNQTKQDLARESHLSPRLLNNWFKEVRRQIGWVTLCKAHFQGSRALAVEAAHHIFIGRDTSVHLSPHVVADFRTMERRLRSLFSLDEDDTSSECDLLDFSPLVGQRANSPSLMVSSSRFSPTSHSSTWSPSTRSWSSSSTPSLVFTSDDESDCSTPEPVEDGAAISLGKRKPSVDDAGPRLFKRRRAGFLESRALGVVMDDLPCPLSSFSTVLTPSVPNETVIAPVFRKRRLSDAAAEWVATPLDSPTMAVPAGPGHTVSGPHKRRLSVSDSQPAPKRPCRALPMIQRKQVVSDPLPYSSVESALVADAWFGDTFGLPQLEPLSVELFANWSPMNPDSVCYFEELLQPTLPSIDHLGGSSNESTKSSADGQLSRDDFSATLHSLPDFTLSVIDTDSNTALASIASSSTEDVRQWPSETASGTDPSVDLEAFMDTFLSSTPTSAKNMTTEPLSLTPSAVLELNAVEGLHDLLSMPPV